MGRALDEVCVRAGAFGAATAFRWVRGQVRDAMNCRYQMREQTARGAGVKIPSHVPVGFERRVASDARQCGYRDTRHWPCKKPVSIRAETSDLKGRVQKIGRTALSGFSNWSLDDCDCNRIWRVRQHHAPQNHKDGSRRRTVKRAGRFAFNTSATISLIGFSSFCGRCVADLQELSLACEIIGGCSSSPRNRYTQRIVFKPSLDGRNKCPRHALCLWRALSVAFARLHPVLQRHQSHWRQPGSSWLFGTCCCRSKCFCRIAPTHNIQMCVRGDWAHLSLALVTLCGASGRTLTTKVEGGAPSFAGAF